MANVKQEAIQALYEMRPHIDEIEMMRPSAHFSSALQDLIIAAFDAGMSLAWAKDDVMDIGYESAEEWWATVQEEAAKDNGYDHVAEPEPGTIRKGVQS